MVCEQHFNDEESNNLLSLLYTNEAAMKQRGAYDSMVPRAMISLLGEALAAPRVARAWTRPQWCAGGCPGCARELRMLVVPSLDVVQCLFCHTWMFATLTGSMRAERDGEGDCGDLQAIAHAQIVLRASIRA